MKKLLLSVMLIAGCSSERYVKVVDDTYDKAVMIAVPTVVEQLALTPTERGQEVVKSTVTINYRGAGVMISPNGHILTCAHLFDGGAYAAIIVTLSNGIEIPATLVYQDQGRDLAMLKITGRYPYAQLTSDSLQVGQEVLAIGNPKGLSFSVSQGIISAIGRNLGEGFTFTQTDSPINPGNSGGPLFDMKGKLVGINARGIPNTDGLGFAVAPETIITFLDMFKGV